MATLAESFLADLEGLSDASDEEEDLQQQGEDVKVRVLLCLLWHPDSLQWLSQ